MLDRILNRLSSNAMHRNPAYQLPPSDFEQRFLPLAPVLEMLKELSSLPTGFRINWLISYISSLESREEFETGWPGCVRIVGSEVIQFDGLSANRRLRADDTP